ncbi:hypothetical protein M5K25_020238 [Dendrobium thyrsiflorum]|uniref:Uncharacterized protein n=1 Tax=Dendrobium thyrsiflorum TaxID=117978 RepID=A0ABD0UA55_DENTH
MQSPSLYREPCSMTLTCVEEVERIHQGCMTYPRLYVRALLDDVNLCGRGRENPPRIIVSRDTVLNVGSTGGVLLTVTEIKSKLRRLFQDSSKDQKTLEEKIAAADDENKRLQSLLSEKETRSQSQQSPSRVIEEFKKSIAFKMIVQDQIQEARDHIYDIEVKALEQECMEEGFVRGFLKGVRLVHRKTGAAVEGLTPSQASGDSPSDSDGDEIESELQKAFDLEDDTDIEILRRQYHNRTNITSIATPASSGGTPTELRRLVAVWQNSNVKWWSGETPASGGGPAELRRHVAVRRNSDGETPAVVEEELLPSPLLFFSPSSLALGPFSRRMRALFIDFCEWHGS